MVLCFPLITTHDRRRVRVFLSADFSNEWSMDVTFPFPSSSFTYDNLSPHLRQSMASELPSSVSLSGMRGQIVLIYNLPNACPSWDYSTFSRHFDFSRSWLSAATDFCSEHPFTSWLQVIEILSLTKSTSLLSFILSLLDGITESDCTHLSKQIRLIHHLLNISPSWNHTIFWIPLP